MERSKVISLIQVCWRELGPHQEGLLWPSREVHWIPCWLGSYFSSSFLTTFIPPIHARISSLSRFTGCASTPTRLGAPPLVVWLGLTTSWRRTTERKLRGFWGGCDGTFHMFYQVLGWSSCLRSPTNRHAVVRLGRIVLPDSLCHLWFYYSSIITVSIALSTRTNALSVCGISKPPWQSCNGRVRRPLIDCTRRFSVFDPTRPRR